MMFFELSQQNSWPNFGGIYTEIKTEYFYPEIQFPGKNIAVKTAGDC